MTVSYSLRVSRAGLVSYPRLLFLWRGSVYKLIYVELIIYLLLYFALSLMYRFALPDAWATRFEMTCIFFRDGLLNVIPLSFLLGFYVVVVLGRWWDMYNTIPNIDAISQLIATFIRGEDDETRMQRRTLVRWLTLSSTIVFTSVSPPVLKRFPTTRHLVKAGLMSEEERQMYEEIRTPHVKWWLPVSWCCNMIALLKTEGKLGAEGNALIMSFQDYRRTCAKMMDYDWIGVPLVYTQVVTIATYIYFLAKLFSDQFLDPSKGYSDYTIDIYFPVILVLEFIFYFGWLKVAIVLINPYGGDDDDFEINYILDRSYQIGLLIVGHGYGQSPQLYKDKYWCHPEFSLPASKDELHNQGKAWLGSTAPVGFKIGGKKAALAVAWAGNKQIRKMKGKSGSAPANVDDVVINPATANDGAGNVAVGGIERRAIMGEGSEDAILMEPLPAESQRYRPAAVKNAKNTMVMPSGITMQVNKGFQPDDMVIL